MQTYYPMQEAHDLVNEILFDLLTFRQFKEDLLELYLPGFTSIIGPDTREDYEGNLEKALESWLPKGIINRVLRQAQWDMFTNEGLYKVGFVGNEWSMDLYLWDRNGLDNRLYQYVLNLAITMFPPKPVFKDKEIKYLKKRA